MKDAATQPEPAPEMRIDRLVLDIPGLDPVGARTLALAIAEGLAAAGAKGDRAVVSVPLALPPGTPAGLAARIVAAIVERLG